MTTELPRARVVLVGPSYGVIRSPSSMHAGRVIEGASPFYTNPGQTTTAGTCRVDLRSGGDDRTDAATATTVVSVAQQIT